jgi:hypothetical protein
MWDLPASVFVTKDVACYDDFNFDQSKAVAAPFFHAKPYGINEKHGSPNDGQALCIQVALPFDVDHVVV